MSSQHRDFRAFIVKRHSTPPNVASHFATLPILLRATTRRETHQASPRGHPCHVQRQDLPAHATPPPSAGLAANGERQRPRSHLDLTSHAHAVNIWSAHWRRRVGCWSEASQRCSAPTATMPKVLLHATPAQGAAGGDRCAMQARQARESSMRRGAIAGWRVDSGAAKEAAREIVPTCGAPPPTAPRATRHSGQFVPGRTMKKHVFCECPRSESD